MLLGAYPQDLLWGQVGSAQTKNKTSMISRVEAVIRVLLSVEVNIFFTNPD